MPTPKKIDEIELTHLLKVIQQRFVNPYRILYLLDPQQADHFKLRNASCGCCPVNSITIKDSELTPNQAIAKQLIAPSAIASQLDSILIKAHDTLQRIIEKGAAQTLQLDEKAEKYLMDEILLESVTRRLLTLLQTEITQRQQSLTKSIGTWATPATWLNRYPNKALTFLESTLLSSLFNVKNNYGVQIDFVSNPEAIQEELTTLEFEGRFEKNTKVASSSNQSCQLDPEATLKSPISKILKRVEFKAQSKSSFQECLIKISSIPFQLNARANQRCTLSEYVHTCFIEHPSHQKQTMKSPSEAAFLLLVPIGGSIYVQPQIKGNPQTSQDSSLPIIVSAGTLLITNSKIMEISYSVNQAPLFIIRNWLYKIQ